MNKFFTAFFSIGFVIYAHAQQIPLFTQYREAHGAINPASINQDFFTNHHTKSFGVSYRQQWTELKNPPTTQILRGEYFAANQQGVALLTGGYLMNDQTGPTGFTGLYGRIGGVITSDADYSGLSIALSAGAVQYRIKTTDLKLRDPNDIQAQQDRMQIYPDVGMGVFYYQKLNGNFDDDYIYGGLSIPQVLGLDLNFPNGNGTFSTKRIQHYYANVGWYHIMGESMFEPSAWIRYVPGVPISIDLNARYQMGANFWLGAGTSLSGNIHLETGIKLGSESAFKVGYGFDYSTQAFGAYVGGSHEINLSVSF
jgi:type IX secretion system PorP/SprF family membrane protein